MNAYFTASIVGKKHHLADYEAILKLLTQNNITVQADHILKTSEDQIRLETKQERLAFHEQLEKWIALADFVVAEVSFPSISVGYEISLALHRGKPVLVLYENGDPPSLLAQHRDEKLVCERYTKTNLSDIVNDFIHYVQGASDTRFTFFITPSQNSYLERKAKEAKLPKSVYLRKLIEQDMDGGVTLPSNTSFPCPILKEHTAQHQNGESQCYFCRQKLAV